MPNPRVAVIIEDDADIRTLISAVMSQTGLEVHSAAAGLEGIELVRDLDPVVITLDVSMPGIDGFETARRIRAFSDTRILMVTARADDDHARRGREAGADEYITKPFRPRELRARIEAALRAGGGGDQPSARMTEASGLEADRRAASSAAAARATKS